MKKYLLDTNVISELRKVKPHGAAIAWIQSHDNAQLLISAVTMGELQVGLERTRLQDLPKAQEIEMWVDLVACTYQVLPMDTACFREWGRLIRGKSSVLIPDAMIAATARIHDLIVATRNVSDFEAFHVTTLNPFQNT